MVLCAGFDALLSRFCFKANIFDGNFLRRSYMPFLRQWSQPAWIPALTVVADVLETLAVPYRLAGGLAAVHYGSGRPVADIDIDVDDANVGILCERLIAAGATPVRPPSRYEDDNWDLFLATVSVSGFDVDLCGVTSALIRPGPVAPFVPLPRLAAPLAYRRIGSRLVSVIGLEDLLSYKRVLSRPVDLSDLDTLSGAAPYRALVGSLSGRL